MTDLAPGKPPNAGAPAAPWPPAGPRPGGGAHGDTGSRTCPFCGAPAPERTCGACRRDTTAARWPCPACRTMVPTAEATCWKCGTAPKSDLRWKIPLIIALSAVAVVAGAAVNLIR